MKTIFGSPSKQKQQSVTKSAFEGLPVEAQNAFRRTANYANRLIPQSADMFRPIDLTSQEQLAGQMIDPAMFGKNVEQYLNPYRDIVVSDINRQFEAPQSALASRASEAGAFGGSRMRSAQSDLERSRLDAIASALSGQFNTAATQAQQGIGNLLGFGGLQRGLALQQATSPVTGLRSLAEVLGITPTSSSGTSSGSQTGATKGMFDKGKDIAMTAALLSDSRLKKNVKKIGEKIGLNVYEYEYLWSPVKYIGYMAQEVESLYPDAVGDIDGIKYVNYGVLNG